MELPIRLSSAKTLLDNYLNTIDPYLVKDEDGKDQIISELEKLKDKCTKISEEMLQALGYNGTLQSMEKELNQRIKSLQKTTIIFNGDQLNNFILQKLSEAIPYSVEYQQKYEQWLYKFLQDREFIDLDDKESQEIATLMFEDLGMDSNIDKKTGMAFKYYISTRGTIAQGYNRKFGGSTAQLALTSLFAEQKSKKVREALINKIKDIDIKTTKNDIKVGIPLNSKTIYSLLKTSSEPDKVTGTTVEELLLADPDIINKVNKYMIAEIISHTSGADIKLLKECIREIIAQKPRLFFVGNNVNGMTGALGEIQALYYIKCILKDNKQDTSSIKWVGGIKNPHADLVLDYLGQQYGVQVKNTSKSVAELEVSFENFKSEFVKNMKNHNVGFNWLKESANKYNDTITQDPELFNAATNILGMEVFNIPYKWVGSGKTGGNRAFEAGIKDVEEFAPTREKIIEAAEKARRVLVRFFTGMMYIQMSPNAEAGTSSTLYLIGGTLAVTSATILNDIVYELENELDRIKFNFTSIVKDNNLPRIGNIVQFLNAEHGKHLYNTKYILESSYTFKLE